MARGAAIGELVKSIGAVFKTLIREPRYLAYALLVHAGFLLLFVLSFEWTTKPIVAAPEVNVVQAVAVDEAEVRKELDKLREEEARKKAEQEARLRRQQEEARRAEQRRREAEAARQREEQRLVEAKREAEQQRKEAEEAREREQRLAEQRRKEQEAARLAEEQRRKAEEERRKAEEQKRKAEEERKRQQQQLAELKKEEQELARQLEEKERQAEQRRLEEARREEERRRLEEQLAAERAQREQSEVDRYVEIIRNQVEQDWNKPPNWTEGVKCTIRVNLIPGGEVTNVRIVKSCGDPLFDSSVERAVYRASPLTVPPADSGLFERFRELEFVFNPQG